MLPSNDHVVIDVSINSVQVHADIDYKLKKIQIRSFAKSSGSLQALSAQHIAAFQKLLIALPPAINTGTRHGDALTSFVNLMANAPAVAINYSSTNGAFTPICNEIGGPGKAVYDFKGIQRDTVTVGTCYVSPSLGRCGRGAGPDPFVGKAQKFTQECLNHDQCCNVAGDRNFFGLLDVCGAAGTFQCVPEFLAAIPSFFFAPDCGTTEGTWTDNVGFTWSLKGGDSRGTPQPFSGTVDTGSGYFGCGIWDVAGTRTGKAIDFTATDRGSRCAASATFTGGFPGCNMANGGWTNSDGGSGPWSWSRTNTVGGKAVSVRPNASPNWTRGPANAASPAKLR